MPETKFLDLAKTCEKLTKTTKTLEKTKKIKDKKLQETLLCLWETLWINNCKDFDIIANIFEVLNDDSHSSRP